MSAESTVQGSKAERSAPDQDNRYAADPGTIRAFHELLDRQSRGASSFTSPILVAKNNQSPESSAPIGAQVSQEPTDEISDDRRRMITKWIRQDASPNVFQRTFGDSEGKRLADALEGNSELGKLSPAEQSFIMQKTIGQWLTHDGDFSSRAIADFAKAIGGQGDLSTRAGATLAAMSADAMSTYFDSSNDLGLENYAGSLALAAAEVTAGNRASPDAAALRRMIEGMGGQKAALYGDALATAATYSNDASTRLGQVLTAMNQGPETIASAQFALHAFASAGEGAYLRTAITQTGDLIVLGPADAAAPLATAVARIMHPGNAPAQAEETQRLTAVMTSPAGAKLFAPELGSDQASEQLRMEVYNALKAHPEITAKSLMSGSSPWMQPTMAQTVAEKAAQTFLEMRGDKAVAYKGTDLDNMVGVAMHLTPKKAPKNETPQQQEAREKAAAQGQYSYFDEEPERLVRDAIRDADRAMGGDGSAPNATIVPIQVSTPDYGPIQLPLFRVDRVVNGKLQSQFVDNRGARFTTFDEWRRKNALPDGVMTYPAQGHLTAGGDGKALLQSEDTPETHNTWHHVRGYIDKTVLVGGLVAGTFATFGVGMAVAVPVGIGAGLYGAGRATENLTDMTLSHQTINPLRSSEARANYLTAVAGLMGPAGMAAGRFGQAAAEGSALARTVVVGTRAAGITSDALAMGNQMRDAALHWDQMSPDDKIMAGLNFAFWGVTAAAQIRGGMRRMYDFRAQQQRIVNETPTKSGTSKPEPIGTSESEPIDRNTASSRGVAGDKPEHVATPQRAGANGRADWGTTRRTPATTSAVSQRPTATASAQRSGTATAVLKEGEHDALQVGSGGNDGAGGRGRAATRVNPLSGRSSPAGEAQSKDNTGDGGKTGGAGDNKPADASGDQTTGAGGRSGSTGGPGGKGPGGGGSLGPGEAPEGLPDNLPTPRFKKDGVTEYEGVGSVTAVVKGGTPIIEFNLAPSLQDAALRKFGGDMIIGALLHALPAEESELPHPSRIIVRKVDWTKWRDNQDLTKTAIGAALTNAAKGVGGKVWMRAELVDGVPQLVADITYTDKVSMPSAVKEPYVMHTISERRGVYRVGWRTPKGDSYVNFKIDGHQVKISDMSFAGHLGSEPGSILTGGEDAARTMGHQIVEALQRSGALTAMGHIESIEIDVGSINKRMDLEDWPEHAHSVASQMDAAIGFAANELGVEVKTEFLGQTVDEVPRISAVRGTVLGAERPSGPPRTVGEGPNIPIVVSQRGNDYRVNWGGPTSESFVNFTIRGHDMEISDLSVDDALSRLNDENLSEADAKALGLNMIKALQNSGALTTMKRVDAIEIDVRSIKARIGLEDRPGNRERATSLVIQLGRAISHAGTELGAKSTTFKTDTDGGEGLAQVNYIRGTFKR